MKTGTAEERDPLDRYYTPLPFARAHVRRLISTGHIREGSVVLDAGCGDGSYLRALVMECKRAKLANIAAYGVDLDEAAIAKLTTETSFAVYAQDFTANTDYSDVTLVLGNPPFGIAEQFTQHALTIAPFVSWLLQSQFVSGNTRFCSGIWKDLCRVDPFTKRPKFYGPAIDLVNERKAAQGKKPAGGNTVDYSAFTWDRTTHGMDFLGRHIEPVVEDAA
jgi:predicted RNA methylase